MKRTLLFMACMLASVTMFAQNDYRPLVEEGKHWTYDNFMPLRQARTPEYFPEGTKWTEIRLDTLKYDSWYSKVGDEWIPNFETIEYYVKGEYTTKYGDKFKCVYTNGPEWTDSLTLLIQEAEYNGHNSVLVSVLDELEGEPYALVPGEAYQFDWSIGKGIYFTDITMSNTTYLVQYHNYYGIIDEIKEGYFGGVRPLKYVDLDGKAPECGKYDNPQLIDTNGGRIIHGIGITEWNGGECLFGPPDPYFLKGNGGKRHYRSMLVHFERNGEVLYDVWPKKEVAYRPLINDNKEWTTAHLYSAVSPNEPGYQHSFFYEQIKLGSAIEVDGVTLKQIVRSQWNYGEDGPTNWKETDMYIGEVDGKVYFYDHWSTNYHLVQVMDFTLQEGDTYRQHTTNADHDNYADFVVVAVTDTVIATSVDKTPRKCLYIGRVGESKIYDVWVEGIGSLVSGVYGTYSYFMNGAIQTLRSCRQDGQTLYEAYHPFLKEGKTWNYQEYYHDIWNDEQWTKDVSYVINGTTEIDGKTYYKMYRKSEGGSEYCCALREEGRKVWMHTNDKGDCLLYDFGMSVGDNYMPNDEWHVLRLADVGTMRFHNNLLNVLHYNVTEDFLGIGGNVNAFPYSIVEGVGCDEGWNILELFFEVPSNGIVHGENFLSSYEDGKCIFTADDFNELANPKPDDNIAYRPFVEEGKVWKVGTSTTILDNSVQVVDYYYFDGDTIIGGKTCKQMMCQRFVSPDYSNEYWTPTPSLSKVGAWYEEDQKVYFYDERIQSMKMMYDFSLGDYETVDFLNVDGYPSYIIGPRQTGGIKGFKGVYRDIMMGQDINTKTPWLEGVGGLDGPFASVYDPLADYKPEFLMSCTVGDEVIYLNDEYEDGATPAEARKRRFDFSHTIKTKPKARRQSGEEQSLYGEYNDQQLGINLDPLYDAYQVRITDESGKLVYEKAVNAGSIVGLNIDISAYAKGRYTVTVENSQESFTGQFETQATGIEELKNSRIEELKSIYNLQGQRLSTLQKGLNIVNGRKVYVK